MNILDIILLICLIPAVVNGLKKGFIAQVIAIAGLVLGVWMSYKFSHAFSCWIGQWIEGSEQLLGILSFIVIFIGVIFALHLVGKILEASIKIVLLGWLNKLLGVIFSLVKCFLVLGLLILAFEAFNDYFKIVEQSTLDASVLYRAMESTANEVFPYIKTLLFG